MARSSRRGWRIAWAAAAAGDAVEVKAEGDQLRVARGVCNGKASAVIALRPSPGVVAEGCGLARSGADLNNDGGEI